MKGKEGNTHEVDRKIEEGLKSMLRMEEEYSLNCITPFYAPQTSKILEFRYHWGESCKHPE